MIVYGQDRMRCHACKAKWEARTYYESDTNYYELSELTAFCPICGHEPENSHECATCAEADPKTTPD